MRSLSVLFFCSLLLLSSLPFGRHASQMDIALPNGDLRYWSSKWDQRELNGPFPGSPEIYILDLVSHKTVRIQMFSVDLILYC